MAVKFVKPTILRDSEIALRDWDGIHSQPTPFDAASLSEAIERVRVWALQLNAEERCVMATWTGELTEDQAAKRLGIHPTTVGRRRKKLAAVARAALAKLNPQPSE